VPPASQQPFTVRSLAVSGVLAGAIVGVLDGVRAAAMARPGGLGTVATVAFTAGLDTLVGAALGGAAALLTFLARWGRAWEMPAGARALGWVAAGLLPAAAAAGAAAGTAGRNNRFLAAGVIGLAALGAGAVGALVGPALARLTGRRAPEGTPGRPATAAGLLVAAPAAALFLTAIVFVSAWQVRMPLRGPRLTQLVVIAASVAALLPIALALASGVGRSVSRVRALAGAALLYGAPALALVITRWTRDFQYVRWNDVLVVAAIAGVGLALARRVAVKPVVAAGAMAGALGLLLVAGGSEPARKAAARAGLVTPFLDGARVALDFDRDGYTRLLGGGDCHDGDPEINPAAQEWPDDGIDQNCDGKDATATGLRAPPLHPVPDSIPRDLNLILVTIDTLRADRLGAYGYRRPTSPEMDRLAAEGTLFESGWAHAPSTRYSMPALATGRWPSSISWEDCAGCDNWWPRISRDQRTIGEVLDELGYHTGAFYSFRYFGRANARGFERGIDDYQDRRAALHTDVNGPVVSAGSSAREIADDTIEFLDGNKDKKFFLWIHFYDPHLDYQRHAGAPDFGAAPGDLYDGEIWYTDKHLGRVFAHLRQLGLWDRTAVVVTGDHGEGLGEHGISAHGYHLYPPQTKVPFLVRVPGTPPRRVATPVGHVDIAPTLLNLARGPHQPSFLGRSMLDLIVGAPSAAVPPRPVFQEVTWECATGMDCSRRRGIVSDGHHLVWNWMPDNTTECYDLRADPEENRDLWGTSAGAACPPLKAAVQEMVQALSFPPHFAEKIAAGLSAPGAPSPAPQHRREARLGDSVRFLGYDLPSPRVARGGEAEIVYHFEALTRVPDGWRPFFHLEGPGGFRNLDHVPLDGAYPVSRWRPGQRIRDRQRISFPPTLTPGPYSLSLGFYRGNTRMPITPAEADDGTGRLRVVTIDVQ
jgi:arylsulfatase A-like enzyme